MESLPPKTENTQLKESTEKQPPTENTSNNQPNKSNDEYDKREHIGDIETKKKEKIKLPKRKYAIIHGYNGHDFFGNQKNPSVRTVEGEIEKALFNAKFISECNYGNLLKINWMRASRTDKGVSAVMNVISCKLHKYPERSEIDMRDQINAWLPNDIKIFRLIEVSDHFDSKDNNNNREYQYILPSFMLEPRDKSLSIKDIKLEDYKPNFNFKITPEFHEKINDVLKQFLGSKHFHNYTKKVMFSDPQSIRHIYEFSCNDIISYGNDFEAIKFKIIGQSFLYNQIRKMIGMVIECCRESKDVNYIKQSFLSNKVEVPKAPAEGLFLRRIDYSNYNDRKLHKKNNIFITEEDESSMEEFTKQLIKEIELREISDKAFSSWQWRYENHKEYIF